MVVFLLLGVVWAAVLIPPWLQSRRDARPIASMRSFRSQLWSLERATPTYGIDSYTAYGDDVYHDDVAADIESGGAQVHAFELDWRSPASPAVVAGAEDHVPGEASPTVPAVASGRRPARPYRRRRQVLAVLVLATAAAAVPAVLLAGPWVVVDALAATLLVAYVGLLIRRGRREAERLQKVRYLTPIRAPRPSVIVLGSGGVTR
ncbi:MAG TPA: hypothetical protein VFP06_20935 [Acidimicrobiales bacterium]|nr:hypothetical protein [Acidimicrobiales bacterium]